MNRNRFYCKHGPLFESVSGKMVKCPDRRSNAVCVTGGPCLWRVKKRK